MRSVQPLLGYVRNDFPVDEQGIPSPLNFIPSPHTKGHPGYGFERPITHDMWQTVLELWRAGSTPPETALILLDAYYYAATGEIRRSVIDAATACEQAKDDLFERKWRERKSARFKRGRVLTGYDLPHHVSKDIQKMTGRSYAIDHPQQFAAIESLWDASGNIAHGGALTYRSGETSVEVTREEATRFGDAARHCVAWLEAL
jgi:hypothetical protein